MSGQKQSEHGPADDLESAVGVVSIPIPSGFGCHFDGERTGRRPVVGGSHAIRSLSLGSRWLCTPHRPRVAARAHVPHQGGRTGSGLRRVRPGVPPLPIHICVICTAPQGGAPTDRSPAFVSVPIVQLDARRGECTRRSRSLWSSLPPLGAGDMPRRGSGGGGDERDRPLGVRRVIGCVVRDPTCRGYR